MQVTIWTLPTCEWCVKAKKLFAALDWDYEEIEGKNENWKTVPYIEIDGEQIGGFTELASYIRK